MKKTASYPPNALHLLKVLVRIAAAVGGVEFTIAHEIAGSVFSGGERLILVGTLVAYLPATSLIHFLIVRRWDGVFVAHLGAASAAVAVGMGTADLVPLFVMVLLVGIVVTARVHEIVMASQVSLQRDWVSLPCMSLAAVDRQVLQSRTESCRPVNVDGRTEMTRFESRERGKQQEMDAPLHTASMGECAHSCGLAPHLRTRGNASRAGQSGRSLRG